MRRVRLQVALAVLLLVPLARCGNEGPMTSGENPDMNGPDTTGSIYEGLTGTAASDANPVPALWARPKPPTEAAPSQSGGSTALLNEILFQPAAGASQFVEIRAAAGGTSPGGFSLHTETGDTYILPSNAPALGGGELLLLVFDNQNSIDGRTIHASRGAFLTTKDGSVSLVDAGGTELDRVSWGEMTDAVAYGNGGVPAEPEDGMTIGRLPNSRDVVPTAWTLYLPPLPTPGAPNFNPGVTIMFPLNGSVFSGGPIDLSWYPAGRATSYHVQLANNAALAAPIIDQTLTDLQLTTTLGEGTYFWRVQAIFDDGSVADWSLLAIFAIDNSFDTAESVAKVRRTQKFVPTKEIAMLTVSQRKDTTMICTESNHTDAGHEWDKSHPTPSASDLADMYNCALACTAMVNHYYSGRLSQDRIGYEIAQFRRAGPEEDINYGRGNWIDSALAWSIHRPGNIDRTYPPHFGLLWSSITAEIDNGRPVVMIEKVYGGLHATIVDGYDTSTGKRYLVTENPWNPGKPNALHGLRQYDLIPIDCFYLLREGAADGISDEDSIGMDTDMDGINDFDEERRFGTNKNQPDTDSDCIPDKTEIRSSMFDSKHGWAIYWNEEGKSDGAARIRLPSMNGAVPAFGKPEIDVDSDHGGLPDFLEDANHDGQMSAGESDPYSSLDDHEVRVKGTIDNIYNVSQDFSSPNYSNTKESYFTRLHVDLDLKPNFDNGKLEGTAKVTWERHTNFEYRQNAGVCADGLMIDSNTRQWTVNISGQLFCGSDGQIGVLGSGTPDGGDVPTTLHYHDYNCHSGCPPCYDVTDPSNERARWNMFIERGFMNNKLDLKVPMTVPSPFYGEWYHEVHLELQVL